MATNVRMLPPGSGLRGSINVNGRPYTCALGSSIDVPQGDAAVLQANFWSNCGNVGTTAQRPSAPSRGDAFIDTTIAAYIVWDDKAWRNPLTGAAV